MVLNLTAEREMPAGESMPARKASPLLHVLASDGLLCSFSCVNDRVGSQDLCSPAPGLPDQPVKRAGTVNLPVLSAAGSVGSGSSSAAAAPAKPKQVGKIGNNYWLV